MQHNYRVYRYQREYIDIDISKFTFSKIMTLRQFIPMFPIDQCDHVFTRSLSLKRNSFDMLNQVHC